MIGWGIIGVGDVTEVKANAAIFGGDDSRLVHVMRRNGDAARDYAQRNAVPRWSTDADLVINDPEVDVVYIATPTSSHAHYALAALAAGKHVLVEKPPAMDAAQAETMVRAAERADRHLWVAYYRRALPRFEKVRELVSSGAIGDVLAVQVGWQSSQLLAGWRWDPAVNRGGEFAETVCHTIDFLDHLLGPASAACGQTGGDLRRVSASWRHGDVPASGTWVFGAGRDAEFCDVIGDRATLRFSSFTRSAPIEVTAAGQTHLHEVADPPHVHGPLVTSIIDELHGRGTCPSTGATALRTATIIDAILG